MRIFGVMGWKNAGKTSLMERLVADITARGFTVSTVKHVHHDVDLDQPGKDTYRHRTAGATEVVLASAHRFALMHEHRGPEPDLAEVLTRLAPVDLVLVEGYKRDSHAKVEVWRAATANPLIQPGDPHVRAIATDSPLPAPVSVPVLDLNNTAAVADFILDQVGLARRPRFDRVIVADWSASAKPATKPGPDSIWVGSAENGTVSARHFKTRHAAEDWIAQTIAETRAAGKSLLVGFDFAFGYPAGFAARLTGTASAPAVWRWLADQDMDPPAAPNRRFDVAARINRHLGTTGPFWGGPSEGAIPGLPFRKPPAIFAERRVEMLCPAKSVWQLSGAGAVGSQALIGLPMIHRLAAMDGVTVWPFTPTPGPVTLAEVYPSLLRDAVATEVAQGWITDAAQVRLLARALWTLSRSGQIDTLLAPPPDPLATEEGWILGVGHESTLRAALA